MSSEPHRRDIEVPFNAGSKLLDRFQLQWQQIHSKSVNNVSRAGLAFKKIHSINDSISEMTEALIALNTSHKTLSMLDEQIAKIGSDLTHLDVSMRKIEDLLIILKDKKEQEESKIFMDNLDSLLAQRTKDIQDRTAKRREQIKLDHQKRVENVERILENELDERRRVLERTFEEEKQRYLEEQTKDT